MSSHSSPSPRRTHPPGPLHATSAHAPDSQMRAPSARAQRGCSAARQGAPAAGLDRHPAIAAIAAPTKVKTTIPVLRATNRPSGDVAALRLHSVRSIRAVRGARTCETKLTFHKSRIPTRRKADTARESAPTGASADYSWKTPTKEDLRGWTRGPEPNVHERTSARAHERARSSTPPIRVRTPKLVAMT